MGFSFQKKRKYLYTLGYLYIIVRRKESSKRICFRRAGGLGANQGLQFTFNQSLLI